jgi:hypothetical protein
MSVFPSACLESSSFTKPRLRRGMKTEARSPARTFSGWKAAGHGTEIIGCGSGAIGIAGRDPRPSGWQATGIAMTTAGFGSMAIGSIGMTATIMRIGMITMPHHHRQWSIKTGRPRPIAKKFPLLPARTFSGCEAIGYGMIAGSGFMGTTSTSAMTGTGTKAVMSTALKGGSGLKATGAD